MTVPVEVRQADGQFTARVLGSPDIRADAPTRAEAVARVQAEIDRRSRAGEIVFLRANTLAVSDLAGVWKDHPFLDEMLDDIYREREAGKPE